MCAFLYIINFPIICCPEPQSFTLFSFDLQNIGIENEFQIDEQWLTFTSNLETGEYRSSKKWLINSVMHQPRRLTPIQRHLFQVAFSWLDYYHFVWAEIYVQMMENFDPAIFLEIKDLNVTPCSTRSQRNAYCSKVLK